MAADVRTMLVFGATGRSGLSVVESALGAGWRVHVFVRNPGKLPAALAPRLTVVTGDLCDGAAVRAAVAAARPHAVVDCSSALPFGHAKGQPPNNANRATFCRATLDALEADGRLADCCFVIVGGVLVPEPGGSINAWGSACLAWLLRTVLIRAAWREVTAVTHWLFEETPEGARFVYVRMGHMKEEPSRGELRAEPTLRNMPRSAVSYCDVGPLLVRLAGDESRQWERKAVFCNYKT